MTDFQPILRDANARLSTEWRAAGKSVWSADVGERQLEVLDQAVSYIDDEYAPAGLSEVFGTERLIVRDRVYAVDGRRVCWARAYLPAELAEGNPIGSLDTGPGGTPARLAELGHELVSFVEDVEFVEPEYVAGGERDRLQLDNTAGLVMIERRSADASGQVVEVTDMRMVASAYRFRWAWANR